MHLPRAVLWPSRTVPHLPGADRRLETPAALSRRRCRPRRPRRQRRYRRRAQHVRLADSPVVSAAAAPPTAAPYITQTYLCSCPLFKAGAAEINPPASPSTPTHRWTGPPAATAHPRPGEARTAAGGRPQCAADVRRPTLSGRVSARRTLRAPHITLRATRVVNVADIRWASCRAGVGHAQVTLTPGAQ